MSVTTKKKERVKFSKAFWVANTVELLERAAYYGVFVVITLYLSNVLGFTDIQAATIAGVFSACLYLLPTFSGALADKIDAFIGCSFMGLSAVPTENRRFLGVYLVVVRLSGIGIIPEFFGLDGIG